MIPPLVQFRRRGHIRRFFSKLWRCRRSEHLRQRIFRARAGGRVFLTSSQKIRFAILATAIGGIIGFVSFSGFFTVSKVTVLRSSLDLPLVDIELAVRQMALDHNIFRVNNSELKQAVLEIRPDIASVRVRKKYPREIQVEVLKYPIVAELRVGTQRVFINEGGYQVQEDPPARDLLQIMPGGEFVLGDSAEQLIRSDHLATIRDAVFYFEALTDLKILSVQYFPTAREAHLKTERNFDVWLDLALDYRSQIDKLSAASAELELANSELEYIDLRIHSKIFYKPKK